MKLLKRLRVPVESSLVWMAQATIPWFTRRMVVMSSRCLGAMVFHISRRDRKVALANLDVAFGDSMTSAEKKRIVREAFSTFTLVLLDLFWFGRRKGERIDAWVRFDKSLDHYINASPVIAVTAHFGNWEIMGQAVAYRGVACLSVASTLPNKFVDAVVRRLREGTGQIITEQHGAVRAMMRTLKEGGRTAILMDQNTLPQSGGVFVSLFGLPVPMAKTAAALAMHTKAQIVFTYCIADKHGNYTAYALPPCRPDSGAAGENACTQQIALMLETVVRKHPEQWLWMYKRWKFYEKEADGSRYPFYARQVAQIDRETEE